MNKSRCDTLLFLGLSIVVIVLIAFEQFIRTFTRLVEAPDEEQESEITEEDEDALMRKLAKLTIAIRHDLIGDLDARENISLQRIAQQIRTNSAILEDYD